MQAFEELFNQYIKRVCYFALSLTQNDSAADKLTQQTFFKVLKSIDRFQGRSDPATWLCGIAKNEYFNGARKNRERTVEPDSSVFNRDVGANVFEESGSRFRLEPACNRHFFAV